MSNEYSSKIPEKAELRWEHTDRGLYEAEKTLGITPELIEEWKANDTKILEIGTGQGGLMHDLIEAGIPQENIKGLEPGLSFEKPPEVINQLKDSLYDKGLTDIVLPLTAEEAPTAIPQNSIDVAIAQGPNFQNFSRSEADLFRQLNGLSEVVKPGGKIIFEVILDNQGRPNIQIGENTIDKSKRNLQDIDLGLLLDGSGVNYEITNTRGPAGTIEIQVDTDTPQKLQSTADLYAKIEN